MLTVADIFKYVSVFVTLVAASFGLPIPEEIPVVTGGAMSGHSSQTGGHPVWWLMLPVCIAGVVVSDCTLYGIGRWYGPRLFQYRWINERILPPAKREKIEKNFHKYGVKILLVARMLPGIRSPIFITAGIIRLPLSRFLLADGLYAIIGVNVIFWLSFWFTDSFVELMRKLESFRPVIIVIAIAGLAGLALYYFLRHPISTGDPEELRSVPLVGDKMANSLEKLREPATETAPELPVSDEKYMRDGTAPPAAGL